MSEKILFVDDDPMVLAAHERFLRQRFQLETAQGGDVGLQKLAANGSFAVVIADMHMPGMNGIQFLSAVKERAPGSVRIMLTGDADLDTTIRVVNEGNIFRFLTKPCGPEILSKALDDALVQYRLVTAEKELLNKTLSGSIKLLTDLLSAVEAQSFGRAQRLRDLITNAGDKLPVENAWELHLAIMLASIGLVTIPPEILIKSRENQALSKAEETMLLQTPEVAARLLANIPRLENVARIVRYQNKHFDGSGFPPDSIAGEAIPQGARLIKILSDMLQLRAGGSSRAEALEEMQSRLGWYDPALLEKVRIYYGGTAPGGTHFFRSSISLSVKDLAPGMVLHANVETKHGTMILSAGHHINSTTLEKIQNFARIYGVKEPVFIESPTPG